MAISLHRRVPAHIAQDEKPRGGPNSTQMWSLFAFLETDNNQSHLYNRSPQKAGQNNKKDKILKTPPSDAKP
jgi:hypothetical protein